GVPGVAFQCLLGAFHTNKKGREFKGLWGLEFPSPFFHEVRCEDPLGPPSEMVDRRYFGRSQPRRCGLVLPAARLLLDGGSCSRTRHGDGTGCAIRERRARRGRASQERWDGPHHCATRDGPVL